MAETIGLVLLGALGATGVSATAATIVGTVVLAGGLVGAQLLFAPKPDIPKPQDGKNLIKQAVPPPIWGYGESRVAGAYAASEMAGSTSYDVIAIHQGRIDGFTRFYLNEDLVTFDAGQTDGSVNYNNGVGSRYRGYVPDDPVVKIYWRLGLETETAYSQMVAALPGIWTENHRGDGIASALLVTRTPKDKQYTKRLPFGLPKLSVVARWQRVWDFRDPEQIESDRSTWKWSDNPILCLLNFYCHCRAGYQRPVAGVFAPVEDYWIAAADHCDEVMARKSGATEKRYTCGGHFTAETPKKSVVEALLRTCDGWLCERGDGAIIVYSGLHEPTVTITDEHIVEDSLKRGYLEDERFNRLIVKVTSREHDYNEVECDPRERRAEIDAGKPIVSAEAQSEWSTSWTQSERLAAIELTRKRAKHRGTLVLNLFGENLKGRRVFLLKRGAALIPCEIDDLIDDSLGSGTFRVEVRSADMNREAWNPATDEGHPPPIADSTDGGDQPTPPLPALSIIRETSGSGTIVRISAESPPVTGWTDLTLAGRYRKAGETAWLSMTAPDDDLQVFSGPVVDGTYEVQTAYVSGSGGRGDYSPTATIAVVSDPVPVSAPASIAALALDDRVSVTVAAPEDGRVRSVRIFRGDLDDDLEEASDVSGALAISAGQTRVWIDPDVEPGGAYRYFARAYNGSGVASAAAGPAEAGLGDDFLRFHGQLISLGGVPVTLES